MSVMDCIEDEWRTRLRRERSTRVWQAIQCWALMACVQHVTVQRALEMLARKRDEHMSPELRLAVERLPRRRD